MMNTVQIYLLLLKTTFESLIFDNEGEEAEGAAEQAGGRDGAGDEAEGGGGVSIFDFLTFYKTDFWHSGGKEAG